MRTRSLLAIAACASFVLAACSSGGSNPTGSGAGTTTPAAASPGSTVNVTLQGLAYHPTAIAGSVSGSMVVKNEDSVIHNVTIQGTSVNVDVPPGQSVTFSPPAPFPAGTYQVFCKYHKSQGMTATLFASP
jgi:plastocyanin